MRYRQPGAPFCILRVTRHRDPRIHDAAPLARYTVLAFNPWFGPFPDHSNRMTKRIVFAVWGSLGDLYPYLAIARELQSRGHHCVILTHHLLRPRVEAAGLEFAPMDRI